MPSDPAEHVSTGSIPPVQDATSLREAALKSRKARKQATLIQSRQEPDVSEARGGPVEDEDTPMEDNTTRTKPDAEDGEILEVGQVDDNNISGTNAREKTPQPSPEASSQHAPTFAANLGDRRYVRPGLKMTARDLDEAKCLILDLLGLGVKPEYLVDCGVSPQCLAVCFYEMNLRFPLNLDRRQIDLPPIYDLDKHMRDSQRREQIIRQRDRTKAASMLPGVVATATSATQPVSDDITIGSSKPAPERSLEETPRAIRESTSPTPVSNDDHSVGGANVRPRSSGSPTSSGSTPTVDSSAAEDQKRMELLARKAAMESINRKRAAKHNAQPTKLEIQDVESAVDELLASVRMDSASSRQSQDRFGEEGENASSGSGEILPDYDSDAMVEDELDARSSSLSDPGADDKPMEPTLIIGRQRNLSPEYLVQDAPSPSPKLPASRVRFDAPVRSSSLPLQPAPVAVPVVARRSRPIASDFIDQTPPRPASAFQTESDRTAPLKRKRSFVDPAVWPKRLVIDLDSSDEECEGEGEDEANARPSTSSHKTASEQAPSRSTTQDERAAQMLLEKELQIKAMMQRIKMRELQKKKSASGTATPASSLALEDTRSQAPSAVITPAGASTEHATPLLTPRSEILVELTSTENTEKSTPPSEDTLGTNAPKVDKGKGKAIEPEKGNTQELTVDVPTVARACSCDIKIACSTNSSIRSQTVTHPEAQSQHLPDVDSNAPAPTHFKAYISPLIGITSPSLQRSGPTDLQLSTMYWVSSEAGQNQDVDRQLCQYEFPSGICKDQGCKDIHKRDFGASDDQIWKTATSMFPNAGPKGLKDIVARVRQSVQAQN